MNSQQTGQTDGALVQQYLAAVERETSALPADRRQELVSDLAEHIEIALAERPGSSRDILRELGDPRTIATTALQEAGAGADAGGSTGAPVKAGNGKTARRRSPAWVAVALPVLTMVPGQFWGPLGFAFRIAGIIVLCRSPYWTRDQKWAGVAITAALPTAMAMAFNFGLAPSDPPAAVGWTVVAVMAVMTFGGAGWLWKVRDDRDPAA
ncbi:HAAS signaling domain-containing protein [Streptomyces sp. NBC_01237]|uniref:HAAS signaling domain-containing protein n=1 Tax=Streptomyces sp. NBC_01237 TaxID=2903790 RepID=UPI002DDB5D05|nr:hypothetical protein [Streptomyces sp. NBC_01237]WRZ74225.1 DUF1700 domain-containing protein [Streptomyces sp. NBC_01237]